jgi:hypothetical protein
MKFHKTKDGKKILLSDLKLSHLENIIKWIEKKATDGLPIRYGGSGNFAEDMWYDEDTLYGKKAKKEMNYKDYVSELERRRSAII